MIYAIGRVTKDAEILREPCSLNDFQDFVSGFGEVRLSWIQFLVI